MPSRLAVVAAALLVQSSAFAIDAGYARQLERSGCTQASELQGCDISKTKAQNAKAGFSANAAMQQPTATPANPYAGQWVAKSHTGATVATIRIDASEQVWLNGKKVKAKRSDGALVFSSGKTMFTIQGDRRLTGEDLWVDRDAGTQGPIVAQ
jgi:hypothetical protein